MVKAVGYKVGQRSLKAHDSLDSQATTVANLSSFYDWHDRTQNLT